MTREHTAATYLSALQFVVAGMVGLLLVEPANFLDRLCIWIVSLGIMVLGLDDPLVIHERFGAKATHP